VKEWKDELDEYLDKVRIQDDRRLSEMRIELDRLSTLIYLASQQPDIPTEYFLL
jgi:hypothetical protein